MKEVKEEKNQITNLLQFRLEVRKKKEQKKLNSFSEILLSQCNDEDFYLNFSFLFSF